MTDLRDSVDEGWWVDGIPVHVHAYNLRVMPENAPPRRGRNLEVARRHGATYRVKRYAERRQLFSMQVFDSDEYGRRGRDGLNFNLDALKKIWYADGQVEVERRLSLPDGRFSSRTGDGEVVSSTDFDIVQAGNLGRFVVDLQMADPFWYEPAIVLTGKSGTFFVGNPGTVEHHNAVVRIHGPVTDPVLKNLTSGSQITYTGTIADGDWVELDSDLFTVKDQAGVSVVGDVTRTGVFFVTVGAGLNSMELSSGSCDVTFKPAFL